MIAGAARDWCSPSATFKAHRNAVWVARFPIPLITPRTPVRILSERSGGRFGSAAGSPRKDTEEHGRLVCIDCARGWDHERDESHERYASSTINLKASPTWWILLKIPSVTDVNRFGILWETSRSRTFSKVHDIRTFSQTVGAARPSGDRARALHKMAATDLDPPTEFQLMSTRNCGSFRVTSILDSKKLLLRRKS